MLKKSNKMSWRDDGQVYDLPIIIIALAMTLFFWNKVNIRRF
jgi:hypothetical protein